MAGNKIKGITIQIGADTLGLDSALKNIEQKSRKATDELKDVNRTIKVAGDSATLWEQKQKLLNDALEESKKKLKLLEDAQEQVNKQFQDKNISEEQYRAFQREVEYAKSAVDKYEEELAEAKDKVKELGSASGQAADEVENLGDEAEETGEQAKRTADGGINAMTVALGNLVADGIRLAARELKDFAADVIETGSAFEAAMSGVGAVSGASSEEIEQLTEKAESMGATTKYTAAESAEAFKYMAMAGWKTKDMLDGIDGVLSLAAASGEDLGTTSDIVTDAMTAFGLSAENAGHFADVLAAASSNANTNVSMMGETFKYVAPVAGAMHYSIEDTAEAIGLMANAGIKSTQAGTALRSIITRLSTDAGASGKSLGALGTLTEKLGVQFFNADGSARDFGDVLSETREKWKELTDEEQTNYGKTIAGTNAISGWLALMNAAPADVEKLSGAIRDCDGAAQDMSTTMIDNLQGDMTILDSAVDGLKNSLYKELEPSLRSAVKYVTEKMPAVKQAVTPVVKGAADVLGFIIENLPKAVEIGKNALPVITTMGTTLAGIVALNLVSKISGAITVMEKFSLVLAANPAVAVAAGIAGLATAIGLLYVKSQEATSVYDELNKAQQEEYDTIQKNREEMQKLYDTYTENAGTIAAETDRTKELWKELDSLTDSSGRVLDKDKERAQYLLGELNEALGTEYTMTENQIDGYRELADEIDNVIAKKQAEALLDEFMAMNAEHTKSAIQAKTNYEELDKQRDEAKEKVDTAENKFRGMVGKVVGLDRDISAADYLEQYGDNATLSEYANDVKIANQNYANISSLRTEAQRDYLDAMSYMDKLDEAETAFYEKRYDDVKDILYANTDANKQILEDDTSTLEARRVAYKNAIDTVESDFELALRSGRQKEIDAVIETMTETVRLGKIAGVDTSEMFSDEFRKNIQTMLDEGYDISKLAAWGKDSGYEVSDIFGDEYTRVVQEQLDKGYNIADLLIWGINSGIDVGTEFSTYFTEKNQSALNNGYDISALIEWAASKGSEVGDVFGYGFKTAWTQYLYEVNDLINESSINNYSDYLAQNGGIRSMGWDDEKRQVTYATGGYIGTGHEAIVAEAGPELLQVMNGGIKVTPLTKEAKNTPVSSSTGSQKLFYNNYTVNAVISNEYDVRLLAEELAAEQKQIEISRGLT